MEDNVKIIVSVAVFLILGIVFVTVIANTSINNVQQNNYATTLNIAGARLLAQAPNCEQQKSNETTAGDGKCYLNYSGTPVCPIGGDMCVAPELGHEYPMALDSDWNTYFNMTSVTVGPTVLEDIWGLPNMTDKRFVNSAKLQVKFTNTTSLHQEITINESQMNGGVLTWVNHTGYTLSHAGLLNFRNITITAVWASVDTAYPYNLSVPPANYTVTAAGVITNATITAYANTSISYTYTYDNTPYTENFSVASSCLSAATTNFTTYINSGTTGKFNITCNNATAFSNMYNETSNENPKIYEMVMWWNATNSSGINATYPFTFSGLEYTATSLPECNTTPTILNQTGSLMTIGTQYTYDTATATLLLKNSSSFYTDYDSNVSFNQNYCQSGYVGGWANPTLRLVPGLFILGILITVAFVILLITRKNGINI